MRKCAAVKVPKGASTAIPFRFPPPVGGLNTRDSKAVVPLSQATFMRDCYPTTTGVRRRRGYSVHATGLPDTIETLMVYTKNDGTEAMFAASGTEFYNVSSAGAVGAAVVSGLSNSKWESINFTNSSGTAYLCCFNGVDSPRYWNNAAWLTITGASTPSISGLTTTTIRSAFVHQRRMWFVQTNSLKVWYLPIDSVGGSAQALDLGGIATKGGYVVAGSTWTIDAADGPNDLWVVITSEGQLIAYSGTDPSSAASWALIGVWNIAEPYGPRCLTKYRGDLLIITRSGVASAAQIMAGNVTTGAMITDIISGTYAEVVAQADSGGQTLWQIQYFPSMDLLVWCPNNAGALAGVYAMNPITGAWGGEFQINARCMAIFGGHAYYGHGVTLDCEVRKFWAASDDNGSAISAQYRSAFTDMGSPGVIKFVSQGRIIAQCDESNSGNVVIYLAAEFDYKNGSFATFEFGQTVPYFDGISQWIPIGGGGVSVSVKTIVESTDDVSLNGIDVTYQTGGLIGSSALT